jgi:hypothetical protein
MLKLGFDARWIGWIMACVKSVTFRVRLNGNYLRRFKPTRGLRQGDPLSPYLFLLVADGLSRLIQHEIDRGNLQELKICRQSPGISHLLFADDSLLFFRAEEQQILKIKSILQAYEEATGQMLSPGKCSLLLGNKCTEEVGKQTMELLNVQNASFEEKYLGLPVPDGRMKNGKFVPIKDKYKKKMSDWSEKYLAGAAKEVQIKAVMQALSIYPMSVFKFTNSLCEDLMQLIRQFWWGDEHNRRHIHWTSWDNLIKSKSQGGMGFRDLKLFNQALLARQAWRLIAFPESLCARLLKAKYYPRGELTDTTFIKNSSAGWQGIAHGLELLKKGLVWRIGNGERVRIWRDSWIPRGDFKITGNLTKSRLRRVTDIIDHDRMEWKEDIVEKIFMPHDAAEVIKNLIT